MIIVTLEGTCPKCETAMTKTVPIKSSDDFFTVKCPSCGFSLNMRITSIT
jgi:transcription elongation factor Elf1